MIPFEDALSLVLSHAKPLETISVPLDRAFGHCLAELITARMDLPRFDNSAMDGFGVKLADVSGASEEAPARLWLASVVRAGDEAGGELAPGTAVKILTGAPVPAGVEAVVMREYCHEEDGQVLVSRSVKPGENIRRRGEEFRQGDLALPAGLRLNPAGIGLLATLGYTEVPVHRKPRVAVVVTGSELVAPGGELHPGQIYDSNSYILAATLHAMGIDDCRLASAEDTPEAIRAQFAAALEWADVVITVGGVSVGDYDFVKEVSESLDIQAHCWKVAIKPGKPFFFGTRGGRLVCGLPGNPVSALLTFYKLVRPALLRLMGESATEPLALIATLTAPINKKAGRLEFVRGIASVRDGRLLVTPTTGQDSHMLGGFAQANCLIRFPKPAESCAAGEEITIELLDWD
ncbi:MAG: molybdopterin molybdotransferase MoeA [Armatimonadota bacterium]